jgi:hypothetical protein
MKVIKKGLSFLLLLFFSNLNSQSISYEIVGGVNVSNLKLSVNHNGDISKWNRDSRTSFFLGGGIEFPVKIAKSNKFSLNIQLQYSQQGNFVEDFNNENNFDEINQINLPVRIKAELFDNLFIGLGGYLGYLVFVDDYLYEDEKNYSNFDSGALVSIEYKLYKKISIEAKYLVGLTDVLNREYDNGEYKHNRFNRVFQIGLNYKF